jgi:membrane protein YqaA with SNARE-associated domain|tara:strand:- start:657 stop:1163 length:507 start_codon:yes stop_codon:yes gene_type:complete
VNFYEIFLENLSELGYLGAIIAGFLGSSTLFFSIFPSFIAIPIIGSQLNPLFVGIFAGLGAGIGQFLHYYIGVGGRKLLSKKKNIIKKIDMSKEKNEKWKKRIDKYGVGLIFLFAATPLTPDDILWIPLGIMGYPKVRALIAAILGKIALNLLYAYAGSFGLEFLLEL